MEGEKLYKRLYMLLYNRINDAIMALERGDAAQARAILICAQQDAEELFIEGET